MKTNTAKILLPLTLLLAAGCAGNRAPASGKTAAERVIFFARLRASDPKALWDRESELRADLDQDGVADYALRGLRKDRVVVGIVQGPPGPQSRTWTLDFPWGKGTQDSLCSRQAKIEVEDMDEAAAAGSRPTSGKPPRTGKGISLYDDRCDAFHIYWSPEERKFDWWRL
jgi:hypothetical protein